jgi:hypothetical protein
MLKDVKGLPVSEKTNRFPHLHLAVPVLILTAFCICRTSNA